MSTHRRMSMGLAANSLEGVAVVVEVTGKLSDLPVATADFLSELLSAVSYGNGDWIADVQKTTHAHGESIVVTVAACWKAGNGVHVSFQRDSVGIYGPIDWTYWKAGDDLPTEVPSGDGVLAYCSAGDTVELAYYSADVVRALVAVLGNSASKKHRGGTIHATRRKSRMHPSPRISEN
jgi:hypothetical protein